MEKEQVDCIHVLQTLAHLYALILIGQESIKKGWKVLVRMASHYKSNKRALPSEVECVCVLSLRLPDSKAQGSDLSLSLPDSKAQGSDLSLRLPDSNA